MAKDGESANLNRAHWLCVLIGHKFRARYNRSAPTIGRVEGLGGKVLIDLVNAHRIQTYKRDVCERCGSVAQQESETSQ